MMSVVNEEAENIVHDAAEAGIIEAGESGATGVESDSADFPPVDVEAALAEAEAELAKAAGTVNLGAGRDAASVEPPTMEPPPTATLPTDVGLDAPSSATPARDPDPAGAPDTAAWDDQAGGTADTGGPVVDTSMAPVELGDAHSTPDDGVEGARETATFDVDTVDIDTVCRPAVDMIALAGASSSQGRVQHPSVDPSLTPAQAEKAVADIERGIRSLAALLETQITEQWRLAREGFAEADAARAKTHEASRSAQAMLQEIARLREEARIARDDADVARRETKLMREDAQRAKERAEASAAGAELAAEQTQREAELAVGRVETAAS